VRKALQTFEIHGANRLNKLVDSLPNFAFLNGVLCSHEWSSLLSQ
jgi:hypothetical protein